LSFNETTRILPNRNSRRQSDGDLLSEARTGDSNAHVEPACGYGSQQSRENFTISKWEDDSEVAAAVDAAAEKLKSI